MANNKIDELELQTLFARLDTYIPDHEKDEEERNQEFTAAGQFRMDIENLLNQANLQVSGTDARNNLYGQVRERMAEANQWLNQFQGLDQEGEEDHREDETVATSSNPPLNPTGPLAVQYPSEIDILADEIYQYIAKFDLKRYLIEDTILRPEIDQLFEDGRQARNLMGYLQSGGGDTEDLAREWLKKKKTERGESDDTEGKGFSVLVVDDNPFLRECRRKLMIMLGREKKLEMDVQVAKNGNEALYLHFAGACFDAIIMDDLMPIMNGAETTRKLRKMGVRCRIVGVTSQSDRRAFMDAGVDSFASKPLTLDKLRFIFRNLNQGRVLNDHNEFGNQTQRLAALLNQCFEDFRDKQCELGKTMSDEIKQLEKSQEEAIGRLKLLLSFDQKSNSEMQPIIADVTRWLNQKTPKKNKRISVLIVEDERILRDSHGRLIMSFGEQKKLQLEVQEAKNGKEAVYLHLAGASFYFILMDDEMPIMNGSQATKQLRKMRVKSKIVGVTSNPNLHIRKLFKTSGLNFLLEKPLNLEKINAVFPEVRL